MVLALTRRKGVVFPYSPEHRTKLKKLPAHLSASGCKYAHAMLHVVHHGGYDLYRDLLWASAPRTLVLFTLFTS